MENNIIDRLLDENDTEPIVLFNEQGEEVAFEQIAIVPWQEDAYVILKPVEVVDGMADDEALVFVITQENDEALLMLVDDNTVIDAVFEEYYELLAQYRADHPEEDPQ